MRRVIYTAIFGGHERLREPKVLPKDIDLICFTDADLHSKYWTIKKIFPPHPEPRRAARYVKIMAHEFLKEYDQSCWIDGNLIIQGDVGNLFDVYLTNNKLALFDHRQSLVDPIASVKEEAEYLIERTDKGKIEDNPALIKKQLDYYKSQQFPDNQGLAISMILLRAHHDPTVVETMKLWWKQIEQFSVRDQMSFNYSVWKMGLDFMYIPGDSRDNKFFKWVPHEDISWIIRKWHKLLKVLW